MDVWESDPKGFSYHPVGYMQVSHEAMREDVTSIYEQQKEIGYSSEFIEGEKDCMTYMKGLLSDWRAEGITSVLHEKKGGYATNTAAIYGLAGKAEAQGVRIVTGVTVTGFERGSNSDAVSGVVTDRGTVKLVLGPTRIQRFIFTVGRISRRRNPTSGIRRSKSMFHVGLRCANPTYGLAFPLSPAPPRVSRFVKQDDQSPRLRQ